MMYDGVGLPSRLTIRHLEVLREVGRRATWTEAADALGIAQSSVSQVIDRVEDLVGMPLFEAAGVRRVPTRVGSEMVALADRVLADVGVSWEAVRSGDRGGVLSVGVIDAVALHLLPDRLAAFTADHPSVDVRLTVDVSGRLVERLEARDLDVALVTGPEASLPAVEVAAEDLRLYGREGDDPRCVLYPDGSRTRRLIDTGLARMGIVSRVVATASNPAVLRELSRLGGGWTVLPEAVADAPGVPPLRLAGEVVARRPVVALRRQVGIDPLADAFVARMGG